MREDVKRLLLAHDGVSLPVADPGAFLDHGRPLVDTLLFLFFPSHFPLFSAMFAAMETLLSVTEKDDEILSMRDDVHVYGHGADERLTVHRFVPSGDLLRRPTLPESFLDLFFDLSSGHDLGSESVRLSSALDRLHVRGAGHVLAILAASSFDLTTHGGRRLSDLGSDLRQVVFPSEEEGGYRLSVCVANMGLRHNEEGDG